MVAMMLMQAKASAPRPSMGEPIKANEAKYRAAIMSTSV
jgi:hypothetical protein